MLQIPQNLNKDEVLLAIEDVVNRLAPHFTFGSYDVDDLKQEGRILAMEALSRYDPNRGTSLRTFLHNHVRNRYINLKRDRYFRPAPKNLNETQLELWFKRNSGKRSLIDTLDISDDRNEPASVQSESFVNELQQKELFKIIDEYLPVEYRADYLCLLEDAKLPKVRRLKVLEILRSIVNEHFTREEEGAFE